MNERTNTVTKNWGATWVGLFVALFGILIERAAVYAFYPPYSFPAAAWRELLNWVCAIALAHHSSEPRRDRPLAWELNR
jgi:hypothetical protein